MLEIINKRYIFKVKQIRFADIPFDVKGVDRIIFSNCKDRVDMPGFNRKKQLTFVIDLTQDLDKIWKNMSETCRYHIKRAERENVKIKINQNYKEFYRLYRTIRKIKKFSDLLNLEDIKKYATLFVAEVNGKIISGDAFLEDKNNMELWAAGSARFEKSKEIAKLTANAGKLIFWEAIKYAKAKGIKEFDLGGYYAGGMKGETLDTPNYFKQRFGGKTTIRYDYVKDYSNLYRFLSFIKQKLCAG